MQLVGKVEVSEVGGLNRVLTIKCTNGIPSQCRQKQSMLKSFNASFKYLHSVVTVLFYRNFNFFTKCDSPLPQAFLPHVLFFAPQAFQLLASYRTSWDLVPQGPNG